ncbi:MAG: hydrogenase nickel incorporation protein HypB [Clostridiales bacterium]|jgi:hydrogenase nickel incorporation protein HypB|nr:hydrogenase nickel incorporation protein HypB [Eubacteriales bacterium]MDH7567549.1 hydrogenase nickel incorporation protein HypB [Clostridiales bacterium]
MEVKIMKNILGANKTLAEENRRYFKDKHITAVNVMASPGAGKTSVILKLIHSLKDEVNIGVIEGDIASSIDAEKIEKLGIAVIQVNTGGGCHLDANMIKASVESLCLKSDTLLFIENVGNLVCPSAFDLGEGIRMVVASVPEGHDKPFKYISMFEAADVIILNKVDLMPYMDFDRESFYKGVRALNDRAPVFEVSCRTGQGMDELVQWVRQACR